MIGNRYKRQSEIGEGGMGTVYKGLDTQTNEPVAIKLLRSQAIANDPDIINRFRREAEALRELNHPNIVKMLDMIEEDGKYYLVMEYVSGGDLSDLLREGRMPIERILNIGIDLADALTRTHKLGIIHRDLKPANALIAEDGTIRLTDFGIAHDTQAENLSKKKSILGTLYYLSPEVLNNESIDSRADIWSFGVMLYEMVTGTLPFNGESMVSIINSILRDPIPDLETLNPDCPIALVDLIYRMLKKDREHRIRSVRYVGAELEDLLQKIDRTLMSTPHDASQSVGDSRRFETFHILDVDAKHNLPAQTTGFVGRESELEAIAKLVDDPENNRLITILASGGMGKTRLALATGTRYIDTKRFANGVYFVELAPLSSSDSILTAIANAVGFQLAGEGTAEEQILNYFRAKKILLIMDNYEHLLDGVNVVDAILQAAPDVKVIATSREKLSIYGETVFTLSGLEFPNLESAEDALNYNAVKLFMQSAKRISTNYELQPEELTHLTHICRLTYGMPLALELAAAWVEMLSLEEIAQEIEQHLDFLETDMRNMPQRHRSIRAVFDYSFKLLSEEEQTTFTKFAVFRGNFTRQSAQAIAGVGLRPLTALVNKSLLQRNPETGYYNIHELLRQYAEEELKNRDELDTLLDIHSRYYLQTVYDLKDDLSGADQLGAIRQIDGEIENIHAAISYATEQGNYDILTSGIRCLWRFYLIHGHRLLGESLFTRIVDKLENQSPSPELKVALSEARVYLFLFKYIFLPYLHEKDDVQRLLQQCIDDLQDNDEPRLQALLATIRADYHCIYMKVEDARPFCERAIEICKGIGDTWLEAYNWRSLGDTYWYRTQYNPDIHNAVHFYEQARAIIEPTNDIYSKDRVLKILGVLARLDSRMDDAYRLHTESMQMCERLGNHHALAATLYNLGYMDLIQFHHKEARAYLQRSFDIRDEIGESLLTLVPLSRLGELDLSEGKFDTARATFEQGRIVSEGLSSSFFSTFFYAGLAMVDVAEGLYDKSEFYFKKALEHAEFRDKFHVEDIYRAQAIRAREQGNYAESLSHFIKALHLAKELDDIAGRINTQIQIAWLYYRNNAADKARITINDTLELLDLEKLLPVIMMCRLQVKTILGNMESDDKQAHHCYAGALSAVGEYYPVPQMVIFIANVAHYMNRVQRYEKATELASFVVNFKGSYASDSRRARALLDELRNKPDAKTFNAAIERGKQLDLETVVQNLRSEFGKDGQ